MKKNEIKQKLINEDYILTSSIKDKVMNKVGIKKERKPFNFRRVYGSLALAFSLILVFSLFIIKRPENYYTIFVDINPSISLKVNSKEVVKEVTPLNEDGIIFIADLELIDAQLDDAIDIIVSEALNIGYFTDDFANISVSTFGKHENKALKVNEQVERRLQQKVENIVIIDKKEEAKEHGISPGKMAAINKALEADEDLTLEKALKMNEKDLLEKIEDKARKNKQDFDDKFKHDNKDETRIIHIINQMNSIINNVKNRPNKQNSAYHNFKKLYEEYNMLLNKLSEEFLEGDIISDFKDLLDEETEFLDIINNLEDDRHDPNHPGKPDDDKPGPGKDDDKPGHGKDDDKPSPGKDDDKPGPGKDDDRPGGHGKDEDDKPGKNNDDKPNPDGHGKEEDDRPGGKHQDDQKDSQEPEKRGEENGSGSHNKQEDNEEDRKNKQNKNNNNK